jgi:hypothetical protein
MTGTAVSTGYHDAHLRQSTTVHSKRVAETEDHQYLYWYKLEGVTG